ncbi:MAG: hypothetical protein HZB52_04185, partial [Chloroflexi bacterium]|nr:hypothetical protein [Chloroflexota bacterium]
MSDSQPQRGNVNISGGETKVEGDVVGTKIVNLPPESQPPSGSSLPRRERKFIPRKKAMDEVRAALKKGSAAIVGVGGMGGVGKTELAKFFAGELKNVFDDVMWVDVNDRTLAIVHGEMARMLGIKLPDNTDDQGRHSALCAVLRDQRWLIIFDDVRKNFSLELCLPPEPCSALITSRLHDLSHVKTISLDVMEPDEALQLLRAEISDEGVDKEIEAAKVLCASCVYHPLALILAAARLRKRLNVASPIKTFSDNLKDRLTQLRVDQKGKDASLEANFDLSYAELNDDQKKRWRALAVFAPTGFATPAAAH